MALPTQTSVNAGLDDACTFCSSIIGGFSALQNDFDKAICTVWLDLKNNGKEHDCASIEKVISTYYDMIINDLDNERQLPEINFDATTEIEKNRNSRTINIVRRYSGIDAEIVQNSLRALYYATNRGAVSPRILYPRKFYGDTGDPRRDSSILEKYVKTAMWTLGGIAGLAGLFFIAKISGEFAALSDS